jgi:hypothetical protein
MIDARSDVEIRTAAGIYLLGCRSERISGCLVAGCAGLGVRPASIGVKFLPKPILGVGIE